MNFNDFYDYVRSRLPVVTNRYDNIEAIWVENENNLQLAVQYYSWANGNCYDGMAKIDKTDWRGPDWYFCIYDNDKICPSYYLETLTEKKERFDAFCARFEAFYARFVKPEKINEG